MGGAVPDRSGQSLPHGNAGAAVRNLQGKAAKSFKDIPLDQVDSLTEVLVDGVPPLRGA